MYIQQTAKRKIQIKMTRAGHRRKDECNKKFN